MNQTFKVRHKANESLHYARVVPTGIEVNIGRRKSDVVVLAKDYFWSVYEVEETWEKRKKKRAA